MTRLNLPNTSFRLAATVLLALCAQGAGAADYQSTVSGYNPLGYWRLNETTPSPPLNKLANSSPLGSAADGYAVLDVDKGEPGVVGNAIRINNPGAPTAHVGGRVDVPYNPALNPGAPMSIEFWAKLATMSTEATGICPLSNMDCNWYGGANRSGWIFYVNNQGRWQFRLGHTGGYAGICSGTSGNAAVGVWQHIVATYDGAIMRLYANGVEIGTASAAAAGWVRNSQMALRVGGNSLGGPGGGDTADAPSLISVTGYAGNRGWDGWIDELALYNTLLSPETIAAHYSAATTNTAGYGAQILADGAVGYWNMDEAAVTDPDPSTYPVVSNIGSLSSAADATVVWGAATAQNGSGYGGLGAENKACFFDGVNGGIDVADAPGLHFNGNITMMAWVNPVQQDFFRNIIAHGWDNNYAETFLRISRGDGGDRNGDDNYYEVGVTDGQTYYDAAYFAIPPGDIGNWIHLAGTYDGANWSLYRNGVLVASAPSTHGALNVTNRWCIGVRSPQEKAPPESYAPVGLRFSGWIDEPAIFNTALPAAAITTIFNSAQPLPLIVQGLQVPQGVYKGSSASFSLWAEGAPPLTYMWTSNGVTTGVTTTNLALNDVAAGQLTVQAIVSNPYGSATSSVSFLVVAAPPSFTQQPQPVARYTGLPFSFSVEVGGSAPITYQWYKDGAPVSGATSPTYTGTTGATTAGNYYVKVTNEAGTLDSATVALNEILIPPGYPAAVIADTPLSYWRLGEASGTAANDYYGGNNGTYFSALLGQPGYSALDSDTAVRFSGVNNSYVGDISGTAVNFAGTTANFSLEAWVKGPADQIGEATIIAKGAGSSGTTATEQFALDVTGGKYRFFTRGNDNEIIGVTATDGPNGSWQHVVGIYDNTSSLMSIHVNGQSQGSGATRAVGLRESSVPVSIGSKHLGNDPAYDASFNGTIDEVAVYPYALSVASVQAHYEAAYGAGVAPFVAVQPASITNYVSLSAVFSVSAGGSQPLTYQWKKNGVDIASATDSAYTIPSLALDDAGNYSVAIANTVGSTNSAVATLTVLPAPTAPVAIPGLVLHLPFENNLSDTSGRGNNGTARGAISYVTDGALGRALHYSTDATGTNYVTLGVRPDLQFGAYANFSVSYWIRLPANYIGNDLPFFTDAVGSTFGSGYVFAPSYGDPTGADWPGGWAMSVYDAANNGIGSYGDIGSINDGNWHHLVHSINRQTGAVTYLDGRAAHENVQGGTTAAAAGDITTGNAATIGQDPNGTYVEQGSADIDDLGVWRKALTPLEAATVYLAAINQLSFVGGAPFSLTMTQVSANEIQLSWTVGTLQAADKAEGPYTNVDAKSPYTVTIPAAGNKFYRSAL